MGESNRRWQGARGPLGRGPIEIAIVKRDGCEESFNRVKMIDSMRNAGATPREADLVANRVSGRLAPRVTVRSTEVSSMVARSLSHVNPTASRNYVDMRDQKLAYNERVNRLSAEISIISQQVNSATARIESFDGQIQSLPGRITRIRQGNYRLLTHLETDQTVLSEDWMRLSPELRTNTSLKGEVFRTRVRDLQQALTYRLGGADYNLGNLQEIESGIPKLRLTLSEMQSSIVTALSPLEEKYENIDGDLRRVESTVSILDGASFPWEAGETPILATKAKDLNSDLEGFITLTNLRFIFEHEKEIVLKKTLFVVTEKKIVREVMVQKPIGMVTRLVHGKVGFFQGSGLFIEFASETGIPEMRFDTTGQDAESVTKSYNYIISGQADKELAAVAPTVAAEQEAPRLVTCPVCGAPYREKIYRGQTSVNCKYCRAVISLQ
jgi:predicted nuclease with TOPRIM domain